MAEQTSIRYVRFTHEGRTSTAILNGDQVHELEGTLLDAAKPTGRVFPLDEVTLEIPIDPATVYDVVAIDHQYDTEAPVLHPRMHHKLPTALTISGHPIELPPEVDRVRHGGGLVIVIGRPVPRFTPASEALDYVLGVTAGNDVTAAVASPAERRYDGLSWLVSYASDTWAPIGDQVVSGLPFGDLAIEVRVNGRVAASARTSAMATPVADLISYLSEYISFAPGDLVFTGAAPPLPGMEYLHAGDVVEVEIEGLPILRNEVIALDVPALVLVSPPVLPT